MDRGGARKFKDHFEQIAGLQLERADELYSYVTLHPQVNCLIIRMADCIRDTLFCIH